MDIFESLENLPVSEGCFKDIVGIVEDIISETLTYGTVKSAVNTSIPLRLQKYKEVKADPNSTPQDIKRASDRVDMAVSIKKYLKKAVTSDKYKVGDNLKYGIQKAKVEATMSPEEKQKKLDDAARKKQEELKSIWNRQPDHYGSSDGFKYGKKLSFNG